MAKPTSDECEIRRILFEAGAADQMRLSRQIARDRRRSRRALGWSSLRFHRALSAVPSRRPACGFRRSASSASRGCSAACRSCPDSRRAPALRLCSAGTLNCAGCLKQRLAPSRVRARAHCGDGLGSARFRARSACSMATAAPVRGRFAQPVERFVLQLRFLNQARAVVEVVVGAIERLLKSPVFQHLRRRGSLHRLELLQASSRRPVGSERSDPISLQREQSLARSRSPSFSPMK